jgi:predicted HicB family RNase H-like nuclease
MQHEQCSEQIVLRVAPTLREEIERRASEEGRSVSNMTRRILERALSSEPEAA